jgi:DNA polymerase III epsilon subunit-like protein
MILPEKNSLVVIDIETSGVNPFVHNPLALGIVPVSSTARPLQVYIRPAQITWSCHAKELFKGYAREWEAEAVAPADALERVSEYLKSVFPLGRATPVGHNVGFDVAFLRKLAFLSGKEEIEGLSHRAIDTHTILYLLYLRGVLSADALTSDGAFKYFGVEPTNGTRHTAMGDALATRDLLLKALSIL